jgi:serine/threonine-protein kinase
MNGQPNNWGELEPLLDRLLDAAPNRRVQLLDELSGGDTARRVQLEHLLVECEKDRRLLAQPASERFAGLLEGEATELPEMLAERYRIVRELGRGGMGVVYLATDLKHDRAVAVKLVRPGLAAALGKSRFLREIEIAAKLHHPHIVSLYDSGEANGSIYYVMPYEEGLSLRQKLERDGALAMPDALRILREVADAMAYAHRHGIVHRDIKPENVLLADRHASVTDFGIAKALSDAADRQTLTTAGVVLGTPTYMAPEQIAASPHADHRVDIYAFGALAYEVLTGKPPFVRPNASAMLAAHMTEPAEPIMQRRPAIPAPLAALVMRCLEKDPANRWQSADDILHAFDAMPSGQNVVRRTRWAAVAAAIAVPVAVALAIWANSNASNATSPEASLANSARNATIAVLPLQNLGPTDDDYFAAGMTDEITSRLGAVSGLRLISRRAAQRYGNSDLPVKQIGQQLGTDYLLAGNVRWTGGDSGGARRVRITLELLQTQDQQQLWSSTYDRVIDDTFVVQSDIAAQVTQTLGAALLEGERAKLSAVPTANHAAYTLYLKGRYYWNKRSEENIRLALDYFQQAVDLDPGYSRAWVGIADTWISRGWYSRLAPRETFPRAKSAAKRALAFDSTSSEAHATLAHVHLEFDHDWVAAEREYLRAIELDPKNSIARHWYGGFLSAMGRHQEALQQADTARLLDPLAPIIQTWVGLKYYFAGDPNKAIAEFTKALDIDPDFAPAHWHLGWAYEQAGRYDEGVAEAQRALALDEGSLLYLASLGHAYAKAGRHADARAILARLTRESTTRHVSAYHVAVIHIALGDSVTGLDWLERALAEQSPWIGYLAVDPRVASVRSHARFTSLLEKARLQPVKRT